jgi:crotonobetainyl-CoA:carnitine CoA-transferase CaiB-like acyl-CoA transferase
VRADGPGHQRYLHEDPQCQVIGMMTPTDSEVFAAEAPNGRYWRHGPVAEFSETPCGVGKPYGAFGVETRKVLSELGYDEAEIARLKEAGVVTWPEGVQPIGELSDWAKMSLSMRRA